MGALTARQMKLLVLFEGAIERERKTQEGYSELLLLSDDPAIKHIIETFIRQEKQHEETLLGIYSDLRTTGEFKNAS